MYSPRTTPWNERNKNNRLQSKNKCQKLANLPHIIISGLWCNDSGPEAGALLQNQLSLSLSPHTSTATPTCASLTGCPPHPLKTHTHTPTHTDTKLAQLCLTKPHIKYVLHFTASAPVVASLAFTVNSLKAKS